MKYSSYVALVSCVLFAFLGCSTSVGTGGADAATEEDAGSASDAGEADDGSWEPLVTDDYDGCYENENSWRPEAGKAKGVFLSWCLPEPDVMVEDCYGSGIVQSTLRLDGPGRYQQDAWGNGYFSIPPGTYNLQILIAGEEAFNSTVVFSDSSVSILSLYDNKNFGPGAILTPFDDSQPPEGMDRIFVVNASQDHHGEAMDLYVYPADTNESTVATMTPTLLIDSLAWGSMVQRDVPVGTEFFAALLPSVDIDSAVASAELGSHPLYRRDMISLSCQFDWLILMTCDSMAEHYSDDGPCKYAGGTGVSLCGLARSGCSGGCQL
jgi:hypothetical protein